MPQRDFSTQNLSFLPPGRRGARGFSALAPIVVSGSTQPATVLRPVHRSRGLSIPRGWAVYNRKGGCCQAHDLAVRQSGLGGLLLSGLYITILGHPPPRVNDVAGPDQEDELWEGPGVATWWLDRVIARLAHKKRYMKRQDCIFYGFGSPV